MTAPFVGSGNIEAALTKLVNGQQQLVAAVRNLQSPALTTGRATLVAGTATVTTAAVTAASNFRLCKVSGAGTNRGIIEIGTIVSNTSFVINSRQTGAAVETGDTSVVYWEIV